MEIWEFNGSILGTEQKKILDWIELKIKIEALNLRRYVTLIQCLRAEI